MAGDWIKMRSNLHEDPRVVQLATELKTDELHVIGMLWRTWAWADCQSLDGNAISVTETFLDRIVCRDGFAVALRKVGWLEGRNGALTLPRFAEHNGQTAKSRAVTQKRVAAHRNADSVTGVTLPPLPEKRREEYNTPHSPPQAGGEDADASAKPVKPARFRRAVRLETLCAERDRIANEMRDILRPGGCAYNVTPTGEKARRLERLRAAHAELDAKIQNHGDARKDDAA